MTDATQPDLTRAGAHRPPIAGSRQTWRLYRKDLERWKSLCDLEGHKIVPSIVMMGLQKNTELRSQAELGNMEEFKYGRSKDKKAERKPNQVASQQGEADDSPDPDDGHANSESYPSQWDGKRFGKSGSRYTQNPDDHSNPNPPRGGKPFSEPYAGQFTNPTPPPPSQYRDNYDQPNVYRYGTHTKGGFRKGDHDDKRQKQSTGHKTPTNPFDFYYGAPPEDAQYDRFGNWGDVDNDDHQSQPTVPKEQPQPPSPKPPPPSPQPPPPSPKTPKMYIPRTPQTPKSKQKQPPLNFNSTTVNEQLRQLFTKQPQTTTTEQPPQINPTPSKNGKGLKNPFQDYGPPPVQYFGQNVGYTNPQNNRQTNPFHQDLLHTYDYNNPTGYVPEVEPYHLTPTVNTQPPTNELPPSFWSNSPPISSMGEPTSPHQPPQVEIPNNTTQSIPRLINSSVLIESLPNTPEIMAEPEPPQPPPPPPLQHMMNYGLPIVMPVWGLEENDPFSYIDLPWKRREERDNHDIYMTYELSENEWENKVRAKIGSRYKGKDDVDRFDGYNCFLEWMDRQNRVNNTYEQIRLVKGMMKIQRRDNEKVIEFIQRFQERLREVRLNGLEDNDFSLSLVTDESGKAKKDDEGNEVYGERTTVIQFVQGMKLTEHQKLALATQVKMDQKDIRLGPVIEEVRRGYMAIFYRNHVFR